MIHGVDHRFGASIHVQRTVCFVISLVNGLCEVDPYSTWNQTGTLLTTRGKDKVESMFEGLLVFDRTFRD
jgi:hypothetical protein